MTEPHRPITPDLAGAFSDAVLAYETWHPTNEGRLISIGGHGYYKISEICEAVDQFTDPLPPKVFDHLRSYMHDQPDGDLITRLQAHPNYATAAQCLITMMERRKQRG
jgi:hypothetical protein